MLEFLQANPLTALLLILTLGVLMGQARWRGLTLGDSGVLFVALAFGALQLRVPEGVTDLGVVLFLYVVGLQAGPRFFTLLKRRALPNLGLAGATLASAFLAALALNAIFDYEPALMVGLFTGALTTTPGLASALEVLDSPSVSVGYGVGYPFGVIGIILLMQVLPKLLKVNLHTLAKEIEESERPPKIENLWLEVTNPQLNHRRIGDLSALQSNHVLISRVAKENQLVTPSPELMLHLGDHVRVVGQTDRLEMAKILIGPPTEGYTEPVSDLTTETLVVTSEALAGKTLRELGFRERFGVVVTRVVRNDVEFIATGQSTLEIGDTIRVVGTESACRQVVELVGMEEKRLQETRFLPLALGLLTGVLAGLVPIPIPGGTTFQLGLAGGPLLVGLLAGHFGRVGPLLFRVPIASKLFIRQIGLFFFLAGAGVTAGQRLLGILTEQGAILILGAVVLTIVPLITAYLVTRYILKYDLVTALGAICGSMTSTPGLGAVSSASQSEIPSLAYASIYPGALIMVILLTKALCSIVAGP